MFKSQKQIKVVDRIEHFAKPLTPAQLDSVFKSDPNDLILESVSLEDLENTLLFQCEPVPQMMLEAFKSKASMLGQRMKKFANQLSKKTGDITAGDIEIGKPRKSGAVAVQIAKIPLSDGQSVSIAFHAPDNDPLKINSDDTLIAFRFMINGRDVTHTVAPKGGMDVSLKEATTKLGSLVAANSEKFVAAQEKKNADAAALQQAQEEAQALEEQAAALNDETDSLESESDALSKKISRAQTKIDTQNEIQEELRNQLNTQVPPAQEPATATAATPSSGDPYRDLFDEPKLRAAMKTVQAHGPKGTNLISTLGTIADIDINGANGSDRSLFVQNMTGRIKTMHKNGEQQLVDDALTMLSAFNDVADKPAVTSRNGIWKLGNVNEPEQAPEDSPTGDVTHVSFNEPELQANLSGEDKAAVQKLRDAGYEVLFDGKTGYSIVDPAGKVTATGSAYSAFKEHLDYYSEQITVKNTVESTPSDNYPSNQYDDYYYLVDDADGFPTKNSLTKLKAAALDDGEYVIEYGEHCHITVKRTGKEVQATWVVAGGLLVETITYPSLSKLKHYGTEKMEQFGTDVKKTLMRNGYTQEELDRASGATSNVVSLNGAGGEDTPQWDDMTGDERRQAVISAGFPQGYEAAQAELTDKFEQRLQANGRDAATTIPDYMDDVVKDAVALINGGQMDLSELQNENLIELVENNLSPAFPELTEEYINTQLKEALMSVIGRKNIASDWTMDKAEPTDPFVYFYAPDADENDVYGEFLVRAYDNATFSVFHSEGSPLSTEGSTGLTTWDQIKSVILADYAQQQSERQSEQGQSTEPESQSEPDKDLFWYGMSLRPYGMGTTPSGVEVAKFIDNEAAQAQFANAESRAIRHGAVAYDKELTPEQANQFDMVPLFGSNKMTGDADQAYRIADRAIEAWTERKETDGITQDQLNTLKGMKFKSAFSKELRDFDEFLDRREKPAVFAQWNASIELITPEMLQKVAEEQYYLMEDGEQESQQETTQRRMAFIDSAETRLLNLSSLDPKERKAMVSLASRSIRGITKTPKKGEGVQGQAERITAQMQVIQELQGETYASLDERFKNVGQIKQFLAERNIPYTRLKATRASLINSILSYRDDFYGTVTGMFEMQTLRGDLYNKFEKGEALDLKDVENAFGGSSVYRAGDTNLAKAKNEAVVPAEDQQGDDYKKVERIINEIENGTYPNFDDLSNAELFQRHYRYEEVTNVDILYSDGERHLLADSDLTEPEALAIHRSSSPSWYLEAVAKEAAARGFPDISNIGSISHQGALKDVKTDRYVAVGSVGQNDGAVLDKFTGKVVESGFDASQGHQKAKELNEEHQRGKLEAIYRELLDGETLEGLAARESAITYPPISDDMLITKNGLESIYNTLASTHGNQHSGLYLKPNALDYFDVVTDGGELDFSEEPQDIQDKLDQLGVVFANVYLPNGDKAKVPSIGQSRVLITKNGTKELLKLLGKGNAAAGDDADEATKGRTEEQQQLMDLNANEFTSGSIYEEEGITDTTQIAKRIRAFMTQMRKAGRLPSSVKISVKKDGNGINLRLVELPENVTLYNPEFLQWEIDNPQGSLAGAPEQYSEEVRQLIAFVNGFTAQFNYDKSDTMTDYFDVNFYGGRLEVDSDLRRERKVEELAGLEEIHHQGDESAEVVLDVNGIREALDSDNTIMLEQLEEFTNFEIKLGEQSVTLPNGNAKTFKANDEESLIDKIADLHEHLTAALEEKAKASLEALTDWQSQRVYFGDGFQGQINIGKSLSSNPDASIDGLYGHNALSAMIGTQRVLIYPVVRNGEFKFAAYSHDKAQHFGDFDSHSELEMLCIFGLGLTDKAPEQEQGGEEMEHIKKLEAIRDYTGEPEQAVIDKHQNELEAAYAYFESTDSVDENEALMESAMLAITAMIEAL